MLGGMLRELASPSTHRSENLRPDFGSWHLGAAVQIPTAIAYTQFAGFPHIVGLYASILPGVVYTLFGSPTADDGARGTPTSVEFHVSPRANQASAA
jgi:MFS superfamily sulfate permease-like transporter